MVDRREAGLGGAAVPDPRVRELSEVHGDPGPSRFAAGFDRGITLKIFHVDPVRAADRLGSRCENASRAADGVGGTRRTRPAHAALGGPRRGLDAYTRRHRSRAAACLCACSPSGLVAVAADRCACAGWPADRKGVRKKCVPGGVLRDRTPMSDFAVRNDIRQWRLARAEMTQAELARLCGVTRQTIIALEAGKYSPSLELAFKLARALGRNFDEVFRYEEQK